MEKDRRELRKGKYSLDAEPVGRISDGYIGTYFSNESRGIYHFTFREESGEMTEPELFYEAQNAKWVSLQGNTMVFPMERDGRAGACFLELEEGRVNREMEILEEKQTPCYITQDGEWVYTANYHEGTVMVYRLEDGVPSVIRRIENGEGAGCHQILLHESWIMVPCLVQDRIRLYDRENYEEDSGAIVFPEGTGPRHGVFNRGHTRLYVVSEWSNELFIFEVKGKEFQLRQTLSLLLRKRTGGLQEAVGQPRETAAAAVRLTRDERFLYISIRGLDLLCAVDLGGPEAAVVQLVSCGGEHPRDFILSGDERFLLTVNRYKGGMVCRVRDPGSGLLGEIRSRTAMPEGVALILADTS